MGRIPTRNSPFSVSVFLPTWSVFIKSRKVVTLGGGAWQMPPSPSINVKVANNATRYALDELITCCLNRQTKELDWLWGCSRSGVNTPALADLTANLMPLYAGLGGRALNQPVQPEQASSLTPPRASVEPMGQPSRNAESPFEILAKNAGMGWI